MMEVVYLLMRCVPMVSKQMHLPPPCYSFAAIGRAGPRAPCFAGEVHALTKSMSVFIKVQNIFKFPEICIIRYDV